MDLITFEKCNRYGLTIRENVNDTYTICNNCGETFLAIVESNCIVLRHYNWKRQQGGTHFQGQFNCPEAVLKHVFQHGNRLMKPIKQTRMDKLFSMIEAQHG